MPIAAFIKKHRFLRRLLIGAAAFVALYTVLGFLVIPIVARKITQSKLSQLLHRQVTIEALQLNPYTLSVTVRGLRIYDAEGAPDLFSLKRLYVNLQLASLFKGGVVIRQVRIEEPAVHLVRIAVDRYNFSNMVDDLAKTPAAPPPAVATKPTRFSLSSLELVRGSQLTRTRSPIAGLIFACSSQSARIVAQALGCTFAVGRGSGTALRSSKRGGWNGEILDAGVGGLDSCGSNGGLRRSAIVRGRVAAA